MTQQTPATPAPAAALPAHMQAASITRTPSPILSPMHDPKHKAVVQPPVAPLGAANPNPVIPGQSSDPSQDMAYAHPGLGQKALLAKKFAKANKATVSPTDQMQSPCSAKLTSAKKKHFTKGKPASLGSRFMAVAGPETEQDKENAF
ncbi:hypothetical protein NliqN6_3584 [Naganishia liquefaciens]|uniref:Uncharacterized protein n=1 Tax=Naganishia liquefaciens TaxID=104408 RepID=A0A8H3TU27_9TREE|nr:hypothetical protein NliqN6_3584 [Naganishia liquefaciens]